MWRWIDRGLVAFSTELVEGWGAWHQAEDRRVWSVTDRLPDGAECITVVFLGTLEQEGMAEPKVAKLVTVGEDGRYLVHPFADRPTPKVSS